MTMNKEVKTKWVDALRSGDYEQIIEELQSLEGYCCLGVLCRLAKEDGVDVDILDDIIIGGDLEDQVNVIDWSGLKDNKIVQHLICLNDEEHANFEEIADYIEENL